VTQDTPTTSTPASTPAPAEGGRAPARAPHRTAGPREWAILLLVTIVGLVVDLGSKYWAFHSIAPQPVVVRKADVLHISSYDPGGLMHLIPPHQPVGPRYIFQFQLVLNNGAVFGTGQGQRWVFIGFTVVVLIIAVGMFARHGARGSIATPVAVGLLLAGGLGNLYDRIVYACVRDFLHPLAGVQLPFGIRWPNGSPDLWPYVSNVADAFLLVGIVIIVIRLWRADAGKH